MAKKYRKLKHTVGYYLFVILLAFVRLLPYALGMTVFGLVGSLVPLFGGKDLRRMKENIAHFFPDKSERQARLFCRKIYKNQAQYFFAGLKLPGFSAQKFSKYVTTHNQAALVSCLEQGKGIISLSGHVSAFELQTAAVAFAGIEVFSVGATIFDKRVDALFTALRKRNGVGYFHRDGAARSIIRELRANKAFGVLVDQDTTDDGVFVPFLGEMAYTPVSPLRIALKYDVPLCYSLMHRDAKGHFHYTVVGPIELIRTGDLKEELVLNMAAFNRVYSEHIMNYPDQWVWMHRRWKRKAVDYPTVPSLTHYPSKESQ